MSNNFVHIAAFQGPISLSCSYDPEELRLDLIVRVLLLLNAYLPSEDQRLPELLDKYSEHAYKIFTGRLRLEVYRLRDLVLRKVMFKIVGELEKDGFVPYDEMHKIRRMWDDMAGDVLRSLRDDWLELKPGPKPNTSEQERARMLTFYNEVLPTCQRAKQLYKQITSPKITARRKGEINNREKNYSSTWKSTVKQQFPALGDAVIGCLPDHKPCELAEIMTGRHFRKVKGKNLKGWDGLKKQLTKARIEAKTRGK